MKRREFLKTLTAGLTSLALPDCVKAAANPNSKRPNIIVILVDDLGYGDLSSYGAKDLRSPHLDKLMASGMRFDNFYANCPVCSPTRASLLTGRYPDMVGVPGVIRTHIKDNWGWLSPKAVMLPTLLKRQGYHTAIVGKWHLGIESPNTPNERGFDYFWGFLGDMMDDYWHHRRWGRNYMRVNEKEIDPEGHATDLFSDAAIDYLRDRKDKSDPFFLYLAYNAPHTPIHPPKEWVEKVKKREKDITDKRAKLVAFVEHLDHNIGRVIDALDDTSQSQDTLVIFTSDNGGQLSVAANNGPLHGGKQEMYEGGIKEPACAVWPGKIKPAARSSRIAVTMDIFPTVCDVAGVKIEHEIEGRSFLPTLLGKDQSPDDRILFWVRREGNRYGGRAYYAARKGHWKLMQNHPFEPLRLYNLKDDPHEDHPLDEKHKMYGTLFTALRNHVARSGAIPWQKDPVDIDKVR